MKKGTLISQNSFFFSVGERIRTPDLLVRSQTLYPAELRPHLSHSQVLFPDCLIIIAHITGECKRFFKFRIFCLFRPLPCTVDSTKFFPSTHSASKSSTYPFYFVKVYKKLRILIFCKNSELLSCRQPESNRYGRLVPQDFKSCASASSAMPAYALTRKRPEWDSNPRPPP